jgi:hypothetical protein
VCRGWGVSGGFKPGVVAVAALAGGALCHWASGSKIAARRRLRLSTAVSTQLYLLYCVNALNACAVRDCRVARSVGGDEHT